MSEIYKDDCGYTYKVHRPRGKGSKEKGHLKKIYCPLCEKNKNMKRI